MQQLGKVLSSFTVDKWPSSLSYIFSKISVKTFHIIKLRLFSNWMNWRAPWNLQLNLINPPLYQYYKAALYIVSSPPGRLGVKTWSQGKPTFSIASVGGILNARTFFIFEQVRGRLRGYSVLSVNYAKTLCFFAFFLAVLMFIFNLPWK